MIEHRRAARIGKRHVTESDPRTQGDRRRLGDPAGNAPFGAIAGSSRSTAATGADAPSSAQLRPPNAIIDVPTASWAKTAISASVSWPDTALEASAPEHGDVGRQ